MSESPFREDLDLLIVMTSYHASGLTIDCLDTLEPEIRAVPRVAVMVCENGSGPEEVARLEEHLRDAGRADWVVVRPVRPNRGFSGGNNVVLDEAMTWPRPPRNFLLLNTDTLVRPGAIAALLDAASRHPEAGIIGPRLEYPDGTPQTSCFRYRSLVSEMLEGAHTGPIDRLMRRWTVPLAPSNEPLWGEWLSFAAALIRREVVAQIGTLDEGYFLYFDDVDYCRRARDAGWKMLHWPAARVAHLIGQSNPVESLAAERKRRPRYYYESRSRYFAKFYGRAGLWAANLMWGLGRLVSLSRETLGTKVPHTCEKEWRDLWSNALRPLRAPHQV